MEYCILIYSKDVIKRKFIKSLIGDKFNEIFIIEAKSIDELKEFSKVLVFDLAILDLHYNGNNELGLIKTVKKINCKTKILIYTNEDHISLYNIDYLKLGANGVVRVSSTNDVICAAVKLLISGLDFFNDESRVLHLEKKMIHTTLN